MSQESWGFELDRECLVCIGGGGPELRRLRCGLPSLEFATKQAG